MTAGPAALCNVRPTHPSLSARPGRPHGPVPSSHTTTTQYLSPPVTVDASALCNVRPTRAPTTASAFAHGPFLAQHDCCVVLPAPSFAVPHLIPLPQPSFSTPSECPTTAVPSSHTTLTPLRTTTILLDKQTPWGVPPRTFASPDPSSHTTPSFSTLEHPRTCPPHDLYTCDERVDSLSLSTPPHLPCLASRSSHYSVNLCTVAVR
jgi:hypothetical protein